MLFPTSKTVRGTNFAAMAMVWCGVVSIELEEAVSVLDSYTDTILDDLISIRPLLDSLISSKRVFSTIQQYTMDGAVYILAVY